MNAIRLLLITLAFVAGPALAGPTLSSDAYPANLPNAAQPTEVSITVNGAAGPACTLPRAADGSVRPTCDLTSLAPGSYTIVMSVSNPAACPAQTSPATCTLGGAALSAPFLLKLSPGAVTAPVLRVAP